MTSLWMILAFGISVGLAPLIARLASAWGIVDEPTGARKVHEAPTPLLGGVGIFLAFAITIGLVLLTTDQLTTGEVTNVHYMGFLLGGLVLVIGGWLDDQFELKPSQSIWFPVVASLLAIAGGIEVTKLTNPFGGLLWLQAWQSDLLVFAWLLIVMYTTKLLDGLDGLATGVGSVGAFAILCLTLSTAYWQPDVSVAAAVALGAFLGFLMWNWSPAALFLGEGGSTLVGYIVGVLAVISGGKVATALLVLGIPLLDMAWIMVRRARGGLAHIVRGDRLHLHHRLFDRGWSAPQVVVLYMTLSALFGVGGLFLQSGAKALALVGLLGLVVGGSLLLLRKDRV